MDPDAGEGFLTVLRPVESATASSTILSRRHRIQRDVRIESD